jgi:hypothetical protein
MEAKLHVSDQRENVRGGCSAVNSKVKNSRYKELMEQTSQTITFL